MASHRATIVEQFTRQAVPFSTAPGIRDEGALARLVAFAGAGADDVVLDVACGPGLVVAAFARVVRHAVGIDVTPAMLARARELARASGLGNVDWHVGDALRLPFPAAAFSIVSSRFALHHCPDPAAVVAEMARVCRPGGTVVVVDVTASDDPARAAAFNRMERLRDPSHVRALTQSELAALFAAAGLLASRAALDRLRSDVDGMLSRSFPEPGAAEAVRRMFVDALPDDGLGLGARRHGDEIRFAYPVALLAARVPGYILPRRGRCATTMRDTGRIAAGPGSEMEGACRPVEPVLVVEDEADLRELLAGLLEADGYRTVTAANGAAALRLLAESGTRPCLILLDLLMPVMNGWAFLRRAREDRALARVPVILVTGYLPPGDASRLGAVDVLPKPFDLDRLLSLVQAHCRATSS